MIFATKYAKRVIEPLGLGQEMFLGLPEAEDHRASAMYVPKTEQWTLDPMLSSRFIRAGVPGAGGYATARAMAVFYQMMAQGGVWNGVRIVSPRMIDYVTRDFTGDLVDAYTGYPMHRGLGPFSRGQTGHPGPRRHRPPAHVRTQRRRHVLLLGRSDQRTVIRLPEQLPPRQRVAQQAHGHAEHACPRVDPGMNAYRPSRTTP